MKLHMSTIRELVRLMETHGGHPGQNRLISVLSQLDLSTYQQNTTGNQVIVLTEELKSKSGSQAPHPLQLTAISCAVLYEQYRVDGYVYKYAMEEEVP